MTDTIKVKIERVGAANIWAVLTLFFSSILFFYDLFKGRYLLTERDLGPYFIPPRYFLVESIKNGDFPLWNPFQFSGHPFFANPQYAILYPLNGLFFILPFDLAFNAVIILHFFLAGLFTYLLLRDLEVSTTGSLISGLIFMLSGYLLSVHSLLTILLSSIWTPLVIMFFRRAILRPGYKNEIFTAIFIAISFLGGGLEIVYGNFFVLLFMVIFSSSPDSTFVRDKHGRYKFLSYVPIYWGQMKPLLKRFRSLLIVTILFIFLSAIQSIPFLELFMYSIRGNGISYNVATIWSFAPKDILLFFLPDAYGYFLDMKKYWITQCWFKTLYTGGLPFILSLIYFLTPYPALLQQRLSRKSVHGSTGSPRTDHAASKINCLAVCPECVEGRTVNCDTVSYGGKGTKGLPLSPPGEGNEVREFVKDRRLYLALMFLSLFLSLGHYNPIYSFVFKYVPFFNGIRYPAKFLYIFVLVLSISAGLGFQRLVEISREGENKKLKRILIVFSLAFGLLLLFLVLGHREVEHFVKLRGIDFPDFNHLAINLHHAKRFLFYLALFFLLLRVGYEVKWKNWAKVILIFFLTADLFGNMGFYGKEKTSDYFQKTRILEMITSDQGDFRIFSTSKTISMDTTILLSDVSPLGMLKEKHLPSMTLLYKMHNIWGIDVITLKRVSDLYNLFISGPSISTTNIVDFYGMKYVISVKPIEDGQRFELIYAGLEGLQGKRQDLLEENTIKLYKNRKPILRAWLIKNYQIMDSKAMLSRMASRDFHPDREVIFEEEPLHPIPLPQKGMAKDGGAEFISESNNKLQLLVKAPENTFLVLNDTYFPGWKAFVDGIETKIYRADYTFRAISLNAGTHRVEFVYDPLSFKLGAAISIFGVIGCIAMYIFRRKSKNTGFIG